MASAGVAWRQFHEHSTTTNPRRGAASTRRPTGRPTRRRQARSRPSKRRATGRRGPGPAMPRLGRARHATADHEMRVEASRDHAKMARVASGSPVAREAIGRLTALDAKAASGATANDHVRGRSDPVAVDLEARAVRRGRDARHSSAPMATRPWDPTRRTLRRGPKASRRDLVRIHPVRASGHPCGPAPAAVRVPTRDHRGRLPAIARGPADSAHARAVQGLDLPGSASRPRRRNGSCLGSRHSPRVKRSSPAAARSKRRSLRVARPSDCSWCPSDDRPSNRWCSTRRRSGSRSSRSRAGR